MPADAEYPLITIEFPRESDFLRDAPVTTASLGFLTVYNFKDLPVASPDGKANELTPVDFAFASRADNAITIKVDKDYSAAGTGVYSDLIIKIDSTKYAYSQGLKYDGDGNGIGGEAGYDDVYLTKSLFGSDNALKYYLFEAPVNRGWYVSIDLSDNTTPPTWGANNTATTTDKFDIVAAVLTLDSSISSWQEGGQAIYKKVAEELLGSIKLYKLGANGVWTAESASAVYIDELYSAGKIGFKDLELSHGAVYRVTWKGIVSVVTSAEYFGVKQRITFRGTTPNTNAQPYGYWDGDISDYIYNYKAIYGLREVSSEAYALNNDNIKTYITEQYISDNSSAGFSVSRYSYDMDNKNNVLSLSFSRYPDGVVDPDKPQVGLNSDVTGNLAKFKESFKIFYSESYFDSYAKLATALGTDVWQNPANQGAFEIDIEDVKDANSGTLINVLRITIDPAFIHRNNGYYYFLINDGFGYTGGKYVYGNPDNFEYNNFELYSFEIN